MAQSNLNSMESKCDDLLLHDVLKELCEANAEYYKNDNTEHGQRLYLGFLGMRDSINEIRPIILQFQKVVADYDFDKNTPANGYRSFLKLIESAVRLGVDINKQICLKRDGMLFRKTNFAKDVEACAQLLASFEAYFKLLEMIKEKCPKGELFPYEELPHNNFNLSEYMNTVNQYCFYGRCMGFQFCESMRPALKFISLSMAIFSEAYYTEGSLISKAKSSFITSTKYLTDPEEKAKRLVKIAYNADIDFCKAFWFLAESELMKHLPSVIAHKVAVSRVIHIPTESLLLQVNGREISVPVPASYIGQQPVQVRLICWKIKKGMIGQAKSFGDPPSRGLLFHCHGGGFIAQSSRSHEVYLRQWATELDIPILSLDYSLAPKAPFPRALEEALYAYCWTLKNSHLLGSTGERIIAGGDSAGANLVTSLSLKCIELGIPPPDGLFLTYAPFYMNIAPSPSRVLSLTDPLIPFSFLNSCIKAYLSKVYKINSKDGHSSHTPSFEEFSESDLLELQAHKSPVSDVSDTLTYESLTSQNEDVKTDEKTDDIQIVTSECDETESQQYICSFIEKYTSSNVNVNSQNSNETFAMPVISESTSQSKFSDILTNLKRRIENFVSLSGPSKVIRQLEGKNHLNDFKIPIPHNPFISPYCASDDVLQKLPPIKLLTTHMDPCLDDCIMFAKKLKKLKHNVTIDILDGLPHGFLNFSLVSKEAYDASRMCSQKISELLNLTSLPPLV